MQNFNTLPPTLLKHCVVHESWSAGSEPNPRHKQSQSAKRANEMQGCYLP
jgi:hypothetical protein